MQLKTPRRLNTIAVSVALALSAPAAFALPTIAPTQLPGNGAVNYGTATASINTNTNTGTVTVASGATVIDWGVTTGATLFSGSSTPGFNIGASAAVIFNNNSAGTAQVLNVDVTGNPTQIYGALSATTGGSAIAGDAPTIFVANANGIVVGNGAVINAPMGLGLVNADLSGSAAQSLAATMSVLPLSFQGATDGVSISAGADLHGIGSFLLVAGAGTVNIAGNVGTTATEPNVPLYIDGGVGGYASATSGFQQQETGTASSLSTLTTGNYNNGFVYQGAPTTVNLNLGTTQSAYNLVGGSMIGVNGDLNVSGNIANIAQSEISWAGTFTNTGILQSGTQSGVSLAPYTDYTDLTSYQGIYSNTSMAAYGGFVNASGAILNAGSLSFTGASFDNEGTINLGSAFDNDLYIGATQGNITLGGTISLINTGTTASPNHPYLDYVNLNADSIVGQTVNINAALAGVTSFVYVGATNLNVNAPVSVVSSGTGAFYFGAMGSKNASAAPVMNSMNVSSTGSISAPSVYIGTTISGHQAVTNLTVNGSIAATASGGAVKLGYAQSNSGLFSAINNLSGAGSISGDNIDFANLIGSVNNITSGEILSNGFQLKAGPSGTANISASLVGNHPQGFNVKVAGNVVLDSGSTSATSETGNGFQVTPPANLNSRLVVQATGNMLVNAGTAGMSGGEFQVPGLVYLLANQSLTVNTTIDNAYTTNAPVGYGVWLLSPVINDLYPIFTNGNSGVNFMNTNYGYASSINGANPAVQATETSLGSIPTGQNFPAPTVYFNTTGTVNGTVLPYFVNGKGYLQEMQTFLTMP